MTASKYALMRSMAACIVMWCFGIACNAQEDKIDDEIKELSGISIIGNQEAPKSLYIIPWKSSEVGVENELISSLMDDKMQPLDKEVFVRELEFYTLSLSGQK